MKTQIIGLTMSITAAAVLNRLTFVGLDGNPCAVGAKALGTVEADANAGDQTPVNLTGSLLITAGGAIAVGAEVQSDANANAVTLTTGIGNGWALDAAVQAGDVIRIARGI